MTGFRNESEKHHFVERVMMPILNHYCVQHPIKIDYQKLSDASTVHLSLNFIQLAWLQSISEMNIADINSINWGDHNLRVRVMEIQEYLYKISDDVYVGNELKKGVVINNCSVITAGTEQNKFLDRFVVSSPYHRVKAITAI